MNWGIIGLGHMAKTFANSIKELDESNLIGLSSRSYLKLLKFSYKFNISWKNLYRNYDKILLNKNIENIYIGTLNNSHYDLIIKCIAAQKNILCEKPFVLNYKQALDIKSKLRNSKNFFLEGIAYRSHPQTKKIIDLLKNDYIGDVLTIKSSFGFNGGKPKTSERLFDEKFGGGAILDLGCYPISMANLIANHKNNDEIIPKISNISGVICETGVETSAKARLSYSNGIVSEISVSISENLDNQTIISGSKGMIKITDPWLPKKEGFIEVHKNSKIEKLKFKCNLSLFANQIKLFNESILNKEHENIYPLMSVENSVNCMEIISLWKDKVLKHEKK